MEERICKYKDRSFKIIQWEEQKENNEEKCTGFKRHLGQYQAYQHTQNGVPEGEKRKWTK